MAKKTHEEYVAELAIKNPNVGIVGEYAGAHTKITHKCLKNGCDYKWDASPHNILRGRSCPKCNGKMKKTHEEYVAAVELINPNIQVLEKYINNETPILHKCIIHNIEWKIKPNHILQNHSCKKCGSDALKNQRSKSHINYIEELKHQDPNIIVVGEYINAHTAILHKCLIDGHEWYAKPNNILSGKGCPRCSTSHGEKQIQQWLEKYDINYEIQKMFDDCKDVRSLPFDFYLPDYNKAIEYDGFQHFEPVEYFGGKDAFDIRIKHDNIKNEYCKDNGISLLRIPYFKNIEEELNNFLFI